MNEAPKVLLLPGWQNSGPGHWQTRWESDRDCLRVVQEDWFWPRRGDWMARLDEVLLEASTPVVFAAHSLGCHLVAAWAAHSRLTHRVRGALLVAPPDLDRLDMPPQLLRWRPPARERLPFDAIAVISSNDPFADADRASTWCEGWGARIVHTGPLGHLNAESGLGNWPQGWALIDAWLKA